MTKPSSASRPDPTRAASARGRLFPTYTSAEIAADRAVHLVGISAAVVSLAWLVASFGPAAPARQVVALIAYSVGLIGMLGASAAYNLARSGPAKAVLRRLDHAMIFVMIAGSYTPFTLAALAPGVGTALCMVVWGLAAVGVGLKLLCFDRVERASLVLYLGMGWLLLIVIRPLMAVLSAEVMLLLVAGGAVYSLGSLIHARGRIPFHNAIWHAMVLVAAGLHLAAVTRVLAPAA